MGLVSRDYLFFVQQFVEVKFTQTLGISTDKWPTEGDNNSIVKFKLLYCIVWLSGRGGEFDSLSPAMVWQYVWSNHEFCDVP